MRVVFLTHNYPRHSGDLAGAFLHPLALALVKRGHDVRVVAPSDAGHGGFDQINRVPVTRVRYGGAARERYAYTGRMEDALRSPAGWWAILRMIRGLRSAARGATSGAADTVIHAHWWFPAGLAAPPELPTVITLHGTDARLLGRPGARWLARRALRPGRVVTAVSGSVADALAEATGRPRSQIPVHPMPLVLSGRRSGGGDGLVVIGRLTAQKRVHLAIEAHHRLVVGRPDLRLTIIGDGPERALLEARARELGTAGQVRFLGQIATSEVSSAIGDADLCLFPAHQEGLGLAAIEALAAGVPVVACRDGGGLLDIVNDPDAGTITEPDPAALASAASAILDRTGGREAAARVGDLWRERLAPDRVAQQFEERYREARGE